MVLTDCEPGSNSSILLAEGPKSSPTSFTSSREVPRSFSTMADPASASRVANKVAEALVGTDSGLGEEAANFQRGYIRQGQTELLDSDLIIPSNVVSDAMEEWCTGLERRLWAMQYSLLRQLDQHQVYLVVRRLIENKDICSNNNVLHTGRDQTACCPNRWVR